MQTINYVESHKVYNLEKADNYDYGLKNKNNGNASCCAPVVNDCSIFWTQSIISQNPSHIAIEYINKLKMGILAM